MKILDKQQPCSNQTYSSDADTRIVGGCRAGHIPWYVLILHDHPRARCGGALINKFWILSAAHCFCMKNRKVHLPCKRIGFKKEERPWKVVPDYDFSEMQVSVGRSIQPFRPQHFLLMIIKKHFCSTCSFLSEQIQNQIHIYKA